MIGLQIVNQSQTTVSRRRYTCANEVKFGAKCIGPSVAEHFMCTVRLPKMLIADAAAACVCHTNLIIYTRRYRSRHMCRRGCRCTALTFNNKVRSNHSSPCHLHSIFLLPIRSVLQCSISLQLHPNLLNLPPPIFLCHCLRLHIQHLYLFHHLISPCPHHPISQSFNYLSLLLLLISPPPSFLLNRMRLRLFVSHLTTSF